MKKLFFSLMLTILSLNSFAYTDWDIIELNKSFINHGNTYLVEKAVTIFNKEYRVEVSDIALSPTWFHCNIRIKDIWTADDYKVEQSCPLEDVNLDPGNHTGSHISTSLYQGYDLSIDSWMHLQETSNYGDVRITYHIYDYNKQNVFDLILVFPYNAGTITGIEDVNTDQPVIYYNLQGHSSKTPFQGVNIVNGKKILVK